MAESSNVEQLPSKSIEELIASLIDVRAASQTLLSCATRAGEAEAALSRAAAELGSASEALENAGHALNTALHSAAQVASQGGAAAACALLDPTGALLASLRGAGAEAAHASNRNGGPIEQAKALIQEAVGKSSDALNLGVLLSTLALQADPREVAATLIAERNEGVLQHVSAAAAQLKVASHHYATLHTHAATSLHSADHSKSPSAPHANNGPSPSSHKKPVAADAPISPRAATSAHRRSSRPAREWTITMPVSPPIPAPVKQLGASHPASGGTPIHHASPIHHITSPARESPVHAHHSHADGHGASHLHPGTVGDEMASTPIRLAMRAAADICATAASAVSALDMAVRADHSALLCNVPVPTPVDALTSVPRFAAALSASAAGGREAAGATVALTRSRAAAADRVELARTHGSDTARLALGAVRGSLNLNINAQQKSMTDEVSMLAGLSADLAAIEKILNAA
jgi:hypothetical protein